jgi:phage gp36-like protein
MSYLSINDLKKGIRGEALNAIAREEANILQAIAEAQAEVEGYLSARYDIATEFEKNPPEDNEQDTRIIIVVKLVRDIAIYNCFNIANPSSIPQPRIECYDRAIKFLRHCQAEKAAIPELKRLDTDSNGTVSSSYIKYGGNRKRNNQ